MGVVTTVNSACVKTNAGAVISYIDMSMDDGVIVTKLSSRQGSFTVSKRDCYVV